MPSNNSTPSTGSMVPGKLYRTKYPGIYKRRNVIAKDSRDDGVVYVVVWRDRGRQHKKTCATLALAKQFQGEKAQPGESAPAPRDKFEDYARIWLKGHRVSKSAKAAYNVALEQHAIPFFMGRKLIDIEAIDIGAYIEHLDAKGLAPATVRAYVKPVRVMFARALRDRKVRVNPTVGESTPLSRPDDDIEEDDKAMTLEELRRVLDKTPEPYRLFFEFLGDTGLRISEALGLNRKDVEFYDLHSFVNVRRQFYRGEVLKLKTKASRRKIPLSRSMAEQLRPLCQGDDGPLFQRRSGERWDYKSTRRILDRVSGREAKTAAEKGKEPPKAALDHADVPWIGFHTFRHTCASMLFASGKNVKQVAAWLGHANASFTLDTYVHLMDEGVGDASFMDDKFSVASNEGTGGFRQHLGAC